MDLSFFRRAEQGFASRVAAHPDFGMLVATLRSQQGHVRWTAAAAVRDPIAEILLAGPRWRMAVAAQRGCFSPALARQGSVN